MTDVNDVGALERSVDPDGALTAVFVLPGHQWTLSALLPITERTLFDLVDGRRRKFEFAVPSKIRTGVFCDRCQVAWDRMTPEEREGCRGAVE